MTSYLKTISDEAYLAFVIQHQLSESMMEVYFSKNTRVHLGTLLGYAEVESPGFLKTIPQDGKNFLPIRSVDSNKAVVLATMDDIGIYGSEYFPRRVIRDLKDENAIAVWGTRRSKFGERIYISYRDTVEKEFE